MLLGSWHGAWYTVFLQQTFAEKHLYIWDATHSLGSFLLTLTHLQSSLLPQEHFLSLSQESLCQVCFWSPLKPGGKLACHNHYHVTITTMSCHNAITTIMSQSLSLKLTEHLLWARQVHSKYLLVSSSPVFAQLFYNTAMSRCYYYTLFADEESELQGLLLHSQ